MKVNDLLRVTRAVDSAAGHNLLKRRVGYAVVTAVNNDALDLDWLLPEPLAGFLDANCPYVSDRDGDEWTVVPEDKWPTKATVALATRRLTE
jgi:hypothetical protein